VTALDGGEIRWRGAPVTREERRRFGYLPEERGLYPAMGVLDHLVYLGELHGVPRQQARSRALEWLTRLGLDQRAADRVEALSLGNQQRVQLVAALVHDPELLVLDEPFSGLDPPGVAVMSEALSDLAAAGNTVLFSSHQLDLVEDVCQSVAIVDQGHLVAAGPVAELRAGGRRRLAVRVSTDPAGHWAEHLPGVVLAGRDGDVVRLLLDDGTEPRAVLAAAEAAGPVEHFAVERRRLSEVFSEAVGR